MTDDTIAALASGTGKSGVAVIRCSGPAAKTACEAMTGGLPEPRRAVVRSIRDPQTDEILDQALVLWMPGPRTFTGEDTLEFHVHGGRGTIRAVLNTLTSLNGVRLAEPGEFTRRAFLSGKADLTKVEALADLIDAETEAQRRQAVRQLDGGFAKEIDQIKSRIVEALALCEASFDFSDEAEIDETLIGEAEGIAREASQALSRLIASSVHGEKIRDGALVVLAGEPNVGKSSLINHIAKREVAIVTDLPGTTRDVLEVHLDLNGYAVTLMDTAGLRETMDKIEAIGISRTNQMMNRADLVLLLQDCDKQLHVPKLDSTPVWGVRNKIDLHDNVSDSRFPAKENYQISAKTGEGVPELLKALSEFVRNRFEGAEAGHVTFERHRRHLDNAQISLDRFLTSEDLSPDLRVEDLRDAVRSLGRITGTVDVEDLLDLIFGRFCLGK